MHLVDALYLCGNGSSQVQIQDCGTAFAAVLTMLLFISLLSEGLSWNPEDYTASYLNGDNDGI